MKFLSKNTSLPKVLSYFVLLFSVVTMLSATYRYFNEIISHGLFIRLSILSTFLFIFFLILQNAKKETGLNILLATFSSIVGIYIIEIFLQFSFFGSINFQKKEHIHDFDYRNPYQVIESLRKGSIDIVPRIAPATFLSTNGVIGKGSYSPLIPLSGVSQKRTLLCNESGNYAIYSSDKYGFNNKNIVWNNAENWALIGDSFTHGACVDPEDNMAGLLNNQLDNKVINLGYSGNGPILNLASLIEYAKIIKPKKVFWFHCEGNDLTDLGKELENSTISKYMQDGFSQDLIKKQREIDRSLTSHLELVQILNQRKEINKERNSFKVSGVDDLKRILRLYNLREKLRLGSYFSKVPEEFQDVLKRAKSVVSSWGGELYFVYLPTYLRYSSLVENHDNYNHKSKVIKIAKDANIPVIDIHKEVFEKHDDPLGLFPFRINGHYTPEGYRLVSNSVLELIRDNKI